MRRLGLVWISMLAACGDDQGDDESMGGTLGSSDGASSGADDDEGTTIDDGSGSGGPDSSSTAGSGGDTGSGASFECTAGLMCQQDTEYCLVMIGGPVGSRPSYQCAPLPGECTATPTCDCFASVPCGDTCQMVAGGGLEVTCAAP